MRRTSARALLLEGVTGAAISDGVRDNRMAELRVTVQFNKKAREWAGEKGCDSVFGARPLKRFLQRNIESKLACALISGEIAEGAPSPST